SIFLVRKWRRDMMGTYSGGFMAMVRAFLFMALVMSLAACNRRDTDKATATVEQKAKPSVAIVPIFDRTENAGVSWSLSDELTVGIQRKLAPRGKLSLTSHEIARSITKKLAGDRDPFSTDLSWMKKEIKGAEFVIFGEVLQHEEVPVSYANISQSPADLKMSIKLRVVDLRGQQPRIVLQEILDDSYYLPKQFTKENFQQIPWGKENYHVSPLGIAHAKLIKELASRIEDYVLLASGQ
ncbi:MAG: CT253 family lipoprotein, partial [Chlamydiales bacterium]